MSHNSRLCQVYVDQSSRLKKKTLQLIYNTRNKLLENEIINCNEKKCNTRTELLETEIINVIKKKEKILMTASV